MAGRGVPSRTQVDAVPLKVFQWSLTGLRPLGGPQGSSCRLIVALISLLLWLLFLFFSSRLDLFLPSFPRGWVGHKNGNRLIKSAEMRCHQRGGLGHECRAAVYLHLCRVMLTVSTLLEVHVHVEDAVLYTRNWLTRLAFFFVIPLLFILPLQVTGLSEAGQKRF